MSSSNHIFNIYRSYLLKTHAEDRLSIEVYRKCGPSEVKLSGPFGVYALNMNYLSLTGPAQLELEEELEFKLSIKSFLNRWEIFLKGKVVRSFQLENSMNFGVLLEPNLELKYFLKEFVNGFSSSRLKDSLIHSSLSEKKYSLHDGIEIYATLAEFYRQIVQNKTELDLQKSLTEFCKIIETQEANVYIINTNTQKLENKISTRGEKYKNCDYRNSLLGECFTTHETINFKGVQNGLPVSYLIAPFSNKLQHTIGVIELKNKEGEERFSHKDERSLKLLSSLLSALYAEYNPVSGSTKLEEFNHALKAQRYYLGHTRKANQIDNILKKMSLSEHNLLLHGERGTGKVTLIKKIISRSLWSELPSDRFDFEKDDAKVLNAIDWNEPGSLVLENIQCLSRRDQKLLTEKISFGKRRVFTLSHNDLDQLARENRLYQPLYTSLSKLTFSIPPLRQRKSELIAIATQILNQECERRNDQLERTFSPDALKMIEDYSWPGNLTELEKAVRKALLMQPDSAMIDLSLSEKYTPTITLAQKLIELIDHSFDVSIQKKILSETIGNVNESLKSHKKSA
jgi:transcriptional regulator with GAF, ATPase, and Fis domain